MVENYIKKGHRNVEGWLEPAAVEVIPVLLHRQRQLGVTGPACEIGVHHGRLLILLHLLTTGRTVGYDLFEDQDSNVDRSGKGDRDRALENFTRHGDVSRVSLLQQNSMELTAERVIADCADRPAVFSVDGGHTAEITENDLRIAASSIRPGGLVVLDDCFNEAWPAVAEGALPVFRSGLLRPVVIAGNKTIATNDAAAAERYSAAFNLHKGYFWERTVTFCAEATRVVHTWQPAWHKRAMYRMVDALRGLRSEERAN
jgi:hypothetical protein